MANYKSAYTGTQIDAGIAKANTAIQDVSDKQDTLVSGTNIKTINGNSVLGSGNLVIEGGGGGLSSVAHDETLTGAGTNNNPLGVDTTEIATKDDLDDKQDTIDSSHKLSSDLVDDTNKTNKFVTSSEKTTWSGKQDQLVSGTNIKTINNTSILGSGNIEVGGGSSLPISFSTTQPPIDGSVLLWINANAEEPVGDEVTAQSVIGTFSSLEVEDMTEIVSRKYKVNATGTNSPYNCYIVKQGGLPINKIETASWSTTNFLIMGYDPTASAQTDLSVIMVYGIGSSNLGFELPVDGTQTHQQTTNPTVSGSFSDTSKEYIFESKAVGNDLVITATREDTGDLEVTYTFANKARKYVPCFGHGANQPGTINWEFKVVN